jgi:hypothetical protein
VDAKAKPTGVRLEKSRLFDFASGDVLILFRHRRADTQCRDPVIQVSMCRFPQEFGSPGLRPAMTKGENGSKKVKPDTSGLGPTMTEESMDSSTAPSSRA